MNEKAEIQLHNHENEADIKTGLETTFYCLADKIKIKQVLLHLLSQWCVETVFDYSESPQHQIDDYPLSWNKKMSEFILVKFLVLPLYTLQDTDTHNCHSDVNPRTGEHVIT